MEAGRERRERVLREIAVAWKELFLERGFKIKSETMFRAMVFHAYAYMCVEGCAGAKMAVEMADSDIMAYTSKRLAAICEYQVKGIIMEAEAAARR